MKKHYLKCLQHIIATLFFLPALSGCIPEEYTDAENFDNIIFEPNIIAGLGSTQYKVDDFLKQLDEELVIEKKENGDLLASYQIETISLSSEELFSVKDQSAKMRFNIALPDIPQGSGTITLPGSQFPLAPQPFQWNAEGDRLSSMLFESGTLALQINLPFPAQSTFKVELENLRKGKQPLVLEASNNKKVTVSLAGYELTFSKGNQIKVKLHMGELSVEREQYIPGDHAIQASITIEDIKSEHAKGMLRTRSFDFDKRQVDLGLFAQELAGQFKFTNPKVQLIINHNLGTHLGLNLTEIYGVKQNKNTQLAGNITSDAHTFKRAAKPGDEIADTIFIDNTNSNLSDFLASYPEKVILQGAAEVGSLSGSEQFITSKGRMKINTRLVLPFALTMNDFTYTEIIDADPIDVEDSEKIKQATFVLDYENGLPMNLDLQIQLLDANEKVLGSIFKKDKTTILESASVSKEGRALKARKGKISIPLDKMLIEQLSKTKYIRATSSLSSANSQSGQSVPVIFNANDFVKLNLALQAKTFFNLDSDN
ncbi:MAG: hypothetical protein MI784_16220 [Cytophagales bacterium]|nr:hypothetical protein [Cytophagales bacterium]